MDILAHPAMCSWCRDTLERQIFARTLRQAVEPTCAPRSIIARNIHERYIANVWTYPRLDRVERATLVVVGHAGLILARVPHLDVKQQIHANATDVVVGNILQRAVRVAVRF